jgi:hypothetical protein
MLNRLRGHKDIRRVTSFFLHTLGAFVLITGGTRLEGQDSFAAPFNHDAAIEMKRGAITLAFNRVEAFAAESGRSRIDQAIPYRLSGAAFQSQLLLPEYSNSASIAFAPAGSNGAMVEESMLVNGVTPVAESGTCLVAVLATVFLLWQGRIALKRRLGLSSFAGLRILFSRAIKLCCSRDESGKTFGVHGGQISIRL